MKNENDFSIHAQSSCFLDSSTCTNLIKCIELHSIDIELMTLMQLKEIIDLSIFNALRKAENLHNEEQFKNKVNKILEKS